MAMYTYSTKIRPPAATSAKQSDQSASNISRPWVSRAGWQPGLAAPLVNNGELTDYVVNAGQAYMARRRRNAASQFEYYQSLLSACKTAERLAMQHGGLGEAIRQFRDALRDNVGEQAVQRAAALAERVNAIFDGLERAGRDAGADATESVRIINMHLDTVADWNRAVSAHCKAGKESPPGEALADRLSQRESALDELYRHVDIDSEEKRSGSLVISMHGANLVYFDRRAGYAPGHANLTPSAGMLAAQIYARDRLFPDCRKRLAEWAGAFAEAFNHGYPVQPPGRKGERASPGNDIFSIGDPFRLAFDPALVENPGRLDTESALRALASAEEKSAGLDLRQFLPELAGRTARAREMAQHLHECVSWQNNLIAAGSGGEEMRRLVNCQRTFLSVYRRSGQTERLYRNLAGNGL